MNGKPMRTTNALALAFALFFLATTAALAADAPPSADKPEDDKQRIARLEQRIEDLQKQIAELRASQARQNKMPAGCGEECQAQIDELQASQAQQNEILAAQAAEIEYLKNGRTGDDLGRQVRALKERLDALERPVR